MSSVEAKLSEAGVVPMMSVWFAYAEDSWPLHGFDAVMDYCERLGANRHDVVVNYYEMQGPMDEPVPVAQILWRS